MRLYQLRRVYRLPLTVVRTIETDMGRWAEAWLHRRFEDRRIRGEWFHYDPDMATILLPEWCPYAPDLPSIGHHIKKGQQRTDYIETMRSLILAGDVP